MLTKEHSRSFRTKLGLSQRRTAAEAGVPRSYLNQFEMGRWIPTDAFLSKLAAFYKEHGDVTEAKSVPKTANLAIRTDRPASTSDSRHDVLTTTPGTLSAEEHASTGDGWQMLGNTIMAISLVGGVLAVTGNLPAALFLVRRVAKGR